MRKTILGLGLVAALALPGVAVAKPDAEDVRSAKKECLALKKAAGSSNFAALMKTSKRKAYGLCVKQKAAEEQQEEQTALRNAAKQCKAERSDPNFAAGHGGKTFEEHYGTNKNGKNAFGKCVSQKAQENEQEADEQDQNTVNAARACRAEQKDPNFASTHDGKSFADFYGTNANKRNAFGKCVSKKARSESEPT